MRKIVLRFSASYYDVSRVEIPKNWSKIVLRCNPIVLQCDRFQSFNFRPLMLQLNIRIFIFVCRLGNYGVMEKAGNLLIQSKENHHRKWSYEVRTHQFIVCAGRCCRSTNHVHRCSHARERRNGPSKTEKNQPFQLEECSIMKIQLQKVTTITQLTNLQ